MKRLLVRYRNSPLRRFVEKHQKAAPVLFFIGGFIFDTLTLGRIDRLYDLSVLCSHMTLVTITLYLFNVADDGRWKGTKLERFEEYFPLAIQFFFGALSSAYVIYFSRSVSLSKTASFFVILVALLFANEFLKQRISNKNLQFSVYFFISFTFFTFMIPVFLREMSTTIFIISGLVSLGLTMTLIIFIYRASPSTRAEISLNKVLGIVLTIYIIINGFYVLRLIPPVPLALQEGIVAHDVVYHDDVYDVIYEKGEQPVFWRDFRQKFVHVPGEPVYVFSSIFAPTELEKNVIHRWSWYNDKESEWYIMDEIGYNIIGGRNEGYRGYTFKQNVTAGEWKVEVVTEEGLILGVISFEIIMDKNTKPKRLVKRTF